MKRQQTETKEKTNLGFSVSAEELEQINKLLQQITCIESHLAALRIDNLEDVIAAAQVAYQQSPSDKTYKVLEQSLFRRNIVQNGPKLSLALNAALDNTVKTLVPLAIAVTGRGLELYRERLRNTEAAEQARHKELFGGNEPVTSSYLIDQARGPVNELEVALSSLQHGPSASSVQRALSVIRKYAVMPES